MIFIGILLILTNITMIYELQKIYKILLNEKNEIKITRKHEGMAKATFSNVLDPYEAYKDKNSNLYVPRRANGGIDLTKLEGRK